MTGRNDPCWCGSGVKWKKCHFPNEGGYDPKKFTKLKEEYLKKHRILLKDEKQIEGIREACKLTSWILDETCKHAKEGVTTLELNRIAHKLHCDAGAIPASLNYGDPPFPMSICTSLNEVICHGIPEERALKEGDILNIDIGTLYKGYYGDCSRMVTVGDVNAERKLVVDVAYDCLMSSIQILKPGIAVSAIGNVIETIAESRGCSVVKAFVGHGVGLHFHENPQVPHYKNNSDVILVPGMTFTIEPMINAGRPEVIIDSHDQWTARTIDGKASAQWEHTLLITDNGYEVLTPWKR